MPLLVIILAIAIIALGPVFTIVALNTLFNLNITLTIGTWLASLWLMFLFAGSVSK